MADQSKKLGKLVSSKVQFINKARFNQKTADLINWFNKSPLKFSDRDKVEKALLAEFFVPVITNFVFKSMSFSECMQHLNYEQMYKAAAKAYVGEWEYDDLYDCLYDLYLTLKDDDKEFIYECMGSTFKNFFAPKLENLILNKSIKIEEIKPILERFKYTSATITGIIQSLSLNQC